MHHHQHRRTTRQRAAHLAACQVRALRAEGGVLVQRAAVDAAKVLGHLGRDLGQRGAQLLRQCVGGMGGGEWAVSYAPK